MPTGAASHQYKQFEALANKSLGACLGACSVTGFTLLSRTFVQLLTPLCKPLAGRRRRRLGRRSAVRGRLRLELGCCKACGGLSMG